MTPTRSTTLTKNAEKRRAFLNIAVPLSGIVVGSSLIAAAFAAPIHNDILAILGVGAFLHASMEWAIARRLEDFWVRSQMISESFDGAWGEIRHRLASTENRLTIVEKHISKKNCEKACGDSPHAASAT